MVSPTSARLQLVRKLLIGALVALGVIWFVLFVVAMALVSRAPRKPIAGHSFVVWSDHGYLHYVPPSDYAFYEAVMAWGLPIFGGVALAIVLFRAWLAPPQP